MSDDRRFMDVGHFGRAALAALAPTLLFALVAVACQGPDPYLRVNGLATCNVTRQECTRLSADRMSCLETGPVLPTVRADLCFDRNSENGTTACRRFFCNNGNPSPDAPGFCEAPLLFESFAVEGVFSRPAVDRMGAVKTDELGWRGCLKRES